MQSMHALQKQATAVQMHLRLIIREGIAQTLDDSNIEGSLRRRIQGGWGQFDEGRPQRGLWKLRFLWYDIFRCCLTASETTQVKEKAGLFYFCFLLKHWQRPANKARKLSALVDLTLSASGTHRSAAVPRNSPSGTLDKLAGSSDWQLDSSPNVSVRTHHKTRSS